jgi:uncharacterized protein YdeI (YjbR/CyaY-like superfamily)
MTLTHTHLKMPDYVRDALNKRHLIDAYHADEYQQNDYISWITRAKRDETKEKRLSQMLDEFEGGKLYMNMLWARSHTVHNKRSAKGQA